MTDAPERLLAMLLSLGILGLGMLQRRMHGTWATPGALFCGFWFLVTFIPLFAFHMHPVNSLAVGFLLIACLAFSATGLATDWRAVIKGGGRHHEARRRFLGTSFLRLAFSVSFLLASGFLLVDMGLQGVTIREMVFNFFENSNALLARRYEGEWRVSPFGQAGVVLTYVCATLGGLLHAQAPRRARWRILAMAMTPSVLILLISAAKGAFVLAVAIVIGAHILVRLLTGVRPHLPLRGMFRMTKYAPLVLPLILASFLSRGLYKINDLNLLMQRLADNLSVYAFGHLYGFCDWFAFRTGGTALQSYPTEPITYGFFTFNALFELAGSGRTAPPGLYDEYLMYNERSSGNIYTMMRGLITDFGLFGSLAVLLIMGAFFNAVFVRMNQARQPVATLAIAFLFIHILYTSYISSAFVWDSTYAVAAALALIFFMNRLYEGDKMQGRVDENANRSYVDASGADSTGSVASAVRGKPRGVVKPWK